MNASEWAGRGDQSMPFGATDRRVCGARSDKIESGLYVCRENGSHMADGFTGIWSDLSRSAKGKEIEY